MFPTSEVVDSGIYSIVQHPQYTTFIIWAITGMLLIQHWIVMILSIPVITLTYFDLIRADKEVIEKFGNAYKEYMKKVP